LGKGADSAAQKVGRVSSPWLSVQRSGAVARVTLNRPDARNAFNAELISALHEAFTALASDGGVRVVVLAGEGKVFSGGADVNWMRDSLDLTEGENVEDARRLSRMYRAIDTIPKIVVGQIHGAALGGGTGLVAVCDVAISAEATLFGLTETKLGIMPAVISPFVIGKIGASHMRALALTGERFDARRALAIGLVHEVVAAEALEGAVERVVREALSASQTGVAATKALIRSVVDAHYDDTLETTATAIAKQRVSAEGQEGLRAFLERRPAAWAP
jgi:methylglutaconyl-CoA hydratase